MMRIAFLRDTDENFTKINKVLHKNEIVCVITKEQKDIIKILGAGANDVYALRVPYKIGDGVKRYSELPFEKGNIPVVVEMYPNEFKPSIKHKL